MNEVITLIIDFYESIDDFLLESDSFITNYTNWKINTKDNYDIDKLKELMKLSVLRGTNNE